MVKFGITLRMALVFIICGGPLQALTGDLNCNGRVDLSDFFIFADNYGTQGEVGSECAALVGDFDCDSSVDLIDFFIFADNFGKEGVIELGCETVAGALGTPLAAKPATWLPKVVKAGKPTAEVLVR